MALIHWRLVFMEIAGCILGTLAWCLTLVVFLLDMAWEGEDFFLSSSLEKRHHGLKTLNRFFKIIRRNTGCDGFALLIVSPTLTVAIGYALCSAFNNVCRENLKTHRSINRMLALMTMLSGFSLLFTFLTVDTEFYYYVEINFYGNNNTNQKPISKIPIHWPCNYNSIHPSSPLKAADYFEAFAEPSADVPVMGPHTCQYKFYKLSAVGCFFLCMVISRVTLHRINTNLIARLADAPAVANPARYLRQETPLELLRMQHERLARERPELYLQDGSTPGPANRNLGNAHLFPILPSSRTINSFNLQCFNSTENSNNTFDVPPPPYPGTPEVIVPETPHNIPTDVRIIQETNDNNFRESPPPSYDSMFPRPIRDCHKPESKSRKGPKKPIKPRRFVIEERPPG